MKTKPSTSQPAGQQTSSALAGLLLGLVLLISALACNLNTQPPPTIPPRSATNTPQATIGVATLVPIPLPANAQGEAPAAPSIGALLQQVDTERLMLHVQAMQNFETRHVNSVVSSTATRGIGAARQYLEDAFNAIAAESGGRMTVGTHPFTLSWGELDTLQYNVMAILNGTAQGAGAILLSAHYDSTTTDYTNGEVYAPGANDNGSGLAALLEAARILSQQAHRATIIFVAFSAEETGRQGSIRFVDEYINGLGIDLKAVYTLDIIGNTTGPNGEINDSQIRLFSTEDNTSSSRQLARAVQLIAGTYVPELSILVMPGDDREGRWGDHISFNQPGFGYPAVRMIEAMENRNRQHNAQDTIDQINPVYLTRATQITLATLAVFADGLPAPENISLRSDPSSNSTYTLVWNPVPEATSYVIALRQPGAVTYTQVLTIQASNQLTWNGFNPERFEAIAIAAVDENGLWGPFSPEYIVNVQ